MKKNTYQAYNRIQAKNLAIALAQIDTYEYNDETSKEYGMPVYTSPDGTKIFDGSHLSIPVVTVETAEDPDGMQIYNIDIVDDDDVDTYARLQSQIICIRTYVNGCSRDIWRLTDEEDMEVLYTIIAGAVKCGNAGYVNYQEAANVAEWQAIVYFKNKEYEVNSYDTVYNPVKHCPFQRS